MITLKGKLASRDVREVNKIQNKAIFALTPSSWNKDRSMISSILAGGTNSLIEKHNKVFQFIDMHSKDKHDTWKRISCEMFL